MHIVEGTDGTVSPERHLFTGGFLDQPFRIESFAASSLHGFALLISTDEVSGHGPVLAFYESTSLPSWVLRVDEFSDELAIGIEDVAFLGDGSLVLVNSAASTLLIVSDDGKPQESIRLLNEEQEAMRYPALVCSAGGSTLVLHETGSEGILFIVDISRQASIPLEPHYPDGTRPSRDVLFLVRAGEGGKLITLSGDTQMEIRSNGELVESDQ